VFGRRLAGHSHHTDHPLRRRVLLTLLAGALLAALFLLITPRNANGNFVYWTNTQNPAGSVARAKINGTGLNENFIPNLAGPSGVAVDSQHIYWVEVGMSRIGRANLDGTGVIPNLLTLPPAVNGIAVNSTGIYYVTSGPPQSIGHADLNGGNQNNAFINPGSLAADANFAYYLDYNTRHIGRAPAAGGTGNDGFISVPDANCGVGVDSSFLYWGGGNKEVGRAPVGGGPADPGFIPNATPTGLSGVAGVAVNSQYVFWSDNSHAAGANLIGRANIGGGAPNPSLISGLKAPTLMAAAPSNKITVNSVKKNKKKGTASINSKVPGPGQVTMNQTKSPPDVNAVEAGIKQVGLTINQASSFKLAVKPTGKTAKKLNKQVKKQLRKKNRAKAKASVTVFIHFVPAGVAGVPNTQQLKVTLIKQRTKKK
jgi:hypothetical protein